MVAEPIVDTCGCTYTRFVLLKVVLYRVPLIGVLILLSDGKAHIRMGLATTQASGFDCRHVLAFSS